MPKLIFERTEGVMRKNLLSSLVKDTYCGCITDEMTLEDYKHFLESNTTDELVKYAKLCGYLDSEINDILYDF